MGKGNGVMVSLIADISHLASVLVEGESASFSPLTDGGMRACVGVYIGMITTRMD